MNDNERTVPPRPHCCYCSRPLRTGEPHWAGDRQGRAWHYGCAEKAGLTYSWFNIRPVRLFAEEGAERGPGVTGQPWEEARAPG